MSIGPLTVEEYEPMEVGPYEARLISIEEEMEGQFGPQYIWKFEVLEEPYEGRQVKAFSSTSFNPLSKPFKWVEAILGRKLTTGESIDPEDLFGQKVTLHIDHKTTDRGTFDKVTTLTPIKKKGKGEKPAKQPDEDLGIAEEDLEDAPF